MLISYEGRIYMGIFDIFKISQIKAENQRLQFDNAQMQAKMDALGVNEYYETKA